jgi:hypothetical protein
MVVGLLALISFPSLRANEISAAIHTVSLCKPPLNHYEKCEVLIMLSEVSAKFFPISSLEALRGNLYFLLCKSLSVIARRNDEAIQKIKSNK